MYTLRLFHRDNPFQQIEALALADGNLTIGRDASAGLVISDPTGEISRLHCVLAVRGAELALQDLSTNGVFVGASHRRILAREMVPMRERESIHIGPYVIVVEQTAPDHADAPRANMAPSLLRPAILSADSVQIPPDWTTVGEEQPEDRGSSQARKLPANAAGEQDPRYDALVAFCEGAHLDPLEFRDQDPVELMRRAGAIYQQMVLGLGVLMSERTISKGEYGLDLTSFSAQNNNPFRWAPTKHVAAGLLHKREGGFLFGAEAVKASFVDLRKHLFCIVAGSRAALSAVLKNLSPDQIEKSVEGESFVLKNKDAALWRAYLDLHTDVRRGALGDPESAANVAFREGYEHQLRELDALDVLS